MKARILLIGVALAVVSVLVLTGPALAQDGAKKDTASAKTGAYKIGVVDRKKVLDGYKKVKVEYAKLEKEVEGRQEGINALSDKIEKAKKKFEADEPSMTAAEKAEREAAIQADFREYKALLQTQQADIDAKERLVMKQIFTEIDEAVAKIGARDGYYLILEGNTRSGAIYYAASLDMSQRVIDELNGES